MLNIKNIDELTVGDNIYFVTIDTEMSDEVQELVISGIFHIAQKRNPYEDKYDHLTEFKTENDMIIRCQSQAVVNEKRDVEYVPPRKPFVFGSMKYNGHWHSVEGIIATDMETARTLRILAYDIKEWERKYIQGAFQNFTKILYGKRDY